MNILVVVAHPDDEILGMGGTLLKHTKKRDKVRIVFLASGITSRRKISLKNSKNMTANLEDFKKDLKKLHNDACNACKTLNVNDLEFYNLPDNELDSLNLLQIIKIIENEISAFNPDRIYTHHYGDLNVDHRICYQSVLTASRPLNSKHIDLLTFEVPSSTEWSYPSTFHPNYYSNITKELDKKIKALKCYKNELRTFPHPRSTKYVKNLAEIRGGSSGFKAAEAFELIRKFEH